MNHANIVTVYEIVRSGNHTAIAMELVDGVSLREFRASPQPLTRVMARGRQVASALVKAHEKGIVHRDIKPENIMTRVDDSAKVLDFGMARKITIGPQTQSEFRHGGTSQYFSPEQARGEAAMPPSDIFSLGAVLYELACGRHPFEGDSPLATLHRIGHEDPAPPSKLTRGIPRSFDRLILAMLAKDAERRPTAEAVTAALTGHITDQQSQRVSRRNRVITMAMMAVAALAISWFVWKRATTRELALRQLTVQLPDNRVTTGAISPDGKLLAYATVDGIFLQGMRNGETRLLRSPPDFWVNRIRWFKDGERFLAGGFARSYLRPSIWIVSAADANPVLLREDAYDPELSGDARRVAFTESTRSEIWVSDLSGGTARRILSVEGRYLHVLFWSGDATHLAVANGPATGGIDPTAEPGRFGIAREANQFESVDVETGKLDAEIANLDIRSAYVFHQTRILFIGPDANNRALGSELWQTDTDFHTARPTGTAHRLALKPEWIRDVSVAADGHVVTVVHLRSAPTVYVADYSPAVPGITNVRHLTLDASASYPHSWSADSRGVIFESDRPGTNDLFRQNIDSRIAETLAASPLEDFQANLAPDGKAVVFIRSPVGKMLPASIFRVPANGGRPEEIVASGVVDEFRCALPGGKRCVARTTEGLDTFTFWELDPYQSWAGGWRAQSGNRTSMEIGPSHRMERK